ncbi:MAG: DUF4159 domain-containing protein [Pseudomonadota bacterium]
MASFLGSLSFASPLLLAALAALPAIWLILRATPPRPRRTPFPAFDLLRELEDKQRTPARTPLLLLLLRLLIAALAIVALAGPILNAPNTAAGDARPILVVVDDSWTAAANWRLRRNALSAIAAEARAGGRAVATMTTTPTEADAASLISLMDPGAFQDAAAALEPKALPPDYAGAAARAKRATPPAGGYDIRWLSDGLDHPNADDLQTALANLGDVTRLVDDDAQTLFIKGQRADSAEDVFLIGRARAGDRLEGEVVVSARNGRELARGEFSFDPGAQETEARVRLPLALRNDIGAARIEGVASAGAVRLADGRARRALVGFLGDAGDAGDLLAGGSYIRAAMAQYADFFAGGAAALTESDASLIILDDVGRLRDEDAERLGAWVERGGVLLRFAGVNVAEAAQDNDLPLAPAPLRGGGRAFGGALSWETPQPLAAFSEKGPFADLTVPPDVFVRQQVLAAPGGVTTERTWASLSDSTPLVTGARRGAGAIVFFHVTASPEWSDLPFSGVFVEMLRRVAFLSAAMPEERDATDAEDTQQFQPVSLLDGFGALGPAPGDAPGVTLAEAAAGPNLNAPPGLYGAAEAPIAINAASAHVTLRPAARLGGQTSPYATAPPQQLAAPLFLLALILFATDALAALIYAGRAPRLSAARAATSATVIMAGAVLASGGDAFAQSPTGAPAAPFDSPISSTAIDAAIATRLAFVATNDSELDRLSFYGLSALSEELYRRTAVEPEAPQQVDLERDELSVYPVIYWPIAAGMTAPSDEALANVELFMRFGGLVIFDTRDDERALPGALTPERAALRDILRRLDVPPLRPLPQNHVLTRSFYLLSDLKGRAGDGPIWVAEGAGDNDGVTPIIVGGRDWAGAWARDEMNAPMRRMPSAASGRGCAIRPGVPPRECAYRAGVNIAMVALTGNYKSDQVHTPTLLERLGAQ